jgi:hypothetical protein
MVLNDNAYGGREGPFQNSNLSISISELVIPYSKLSFQL